MQQFICHCTVLALFYFEFEGNFRIQATWARIWRGDLSEGFLRYEFGGLIHGVAYFTVRLPFEFSLHIKKIFFSIFLP